MGDLFRQMAENGGFIPSDGRKWGIYSVRWPEIGIYSVRLPKMGDLFRQMARNGDLFRQMVKNRGFIPQKRGIRSSELESRHTERI